MATATTTATTTTQADITPPLDGSPQGPTSATGAWGNDRGDHIHAGIDIPTPVGTNCRAPVDGRVTLVVGSGFGDEGGMIHFEFGSDVGSIKKGDIIGFGHAVSAQVHAGQSVGRGQLLGKSNYSSAPHVHFIYQTPSASPGTWDGTDDPTAVYKFLSQGQAPPGGSGAGQGGGTSGTQGGNASAFAAFFDLPGVMHMAESAFMTGDKSIYNDDPLLPFIQDLAKGSMRHFQSLPNGAFYGFFPDQFGSYHHRKPYWEIFDIEILDGRIQLTDDSLATHVFIAGDTNLTNQIDTADRRASHGVITIYDAFISDFFINKVPEATKDTERNQMQGYDAAVNFLKRYGVRPHYDEQVLIRNGFFEVFYAFTVFQQLWSSQFNTTFQLTFMPELYPGGRVAFPDHDVALYIEAVEHSFDYESGFTTNVNFSSPAAYGKSTSGISKGMIRPFNPADVPDTPTKTGPTKTKK